MTSDLSLGGGVLELAVERLSHGKSPLRMQQPPCPIHTPNTTPHGALASHLLDGFSPRRETTRHIHRPRASSTPTAHHHRWQLLPFPHGTIALAADPPGSSEQAYAPRVCLRVTMHQHRRMWVAARRTRCRCRGVRAEREGCREAVRELAVKRVAGRHSRNTDTLRVHKEAYVLSRTAPSFLARPCRKRGRTPRADASLRVARHLARVKGHARCIYTAQQLTRAAHQP
jgi:hypothetical protein